MLAVHFGAGNIGRGFIGNLLYYAGYETCFVDVNEEIVNLLNERKEYRVVLAEEAQTEMVIKNVRAVNSKLNPELVVEAIANADIITTAIGPNILPFIVDVLAEGLRKRLELSKGTVNIIACENMIGGTSFLKEKLFENLSDSEKEIFEKQFGFPDAAVDRIVPNQVNEDKLMVKVEPFYEWVVEKPKLVGDVPEIDGITYVDNLVPYIERKLFTVNTGHTLAAYFGYYNNIQNIDEAMKNNGIYQLVEGALEESGAFLVEKYKFNAEEHKKYIQKILGRFANSYIVDEVTRVGRSPIRKLGANDRLTSPATQYTSLIGEIPINLVKGIAAALLYDFSGDEEAVKVQEIINEKGIELAIKELTLLDENSILYPEIIEQYKELQLNK